MALLLKFLSPVGKFLGLNKVAVIATIAVLLIGYAYNQQVKGIAVLKERLEQRKQEIDTLKEAQDKEVSNILKLSERIQVEVKAVASKEKKVAEIIKEIPNVPESKSWAETPLPQSIINDLAAINASVRGTEASAASNTTSN